MDNENRSEFQKPSKSETIKMPESLHSLDQTTSDDIFSLGSIHTSNVS